MILLQTIMTGLILERHFENVTRLLARSFARDVSLLIDLYEESDKKRLRRSSGSRAWRTTGWKLKPYDPDRHDAAGARAGAAVLARHPTAHREFNVETGKPFWIDRQSEPGIRRCPGRRRRGCGVQAADPRGAGAGDQHRFAAAVDADFFAAAAGHCHHLSQKPDRPITDLANAAQSFGTGRDAGAFRPRGAREVRLAGEAFLDMRDRIAKQVEQRTTMLAGVSHDLRTILTRFRLELAFLGDGPKVQPLKEDVDEMQRMLEAYMAFVKGDGGETAQRSDLAAAGAGGGPRISESDWQPLDDRRAQGPDGAGEAQCLPAAAFKPHRQCRRATRNRVGEARVSDHLLTLTVDDDGPGIPPEKREEAFRPFVRLDNARNLDETGTGLGLAIALDIARAHGGEMRLEDSPKGGLRAVVQIPV
jgi:two-component system, OmpR family, osmolarity sensor histidine kinase EnvZ